MALALLAHITISLADPFTAAHTSTAALTAGTGVIGGHGLHSGELGYSYAGLEGLKLRHRQLDVVRCIGWIDLYVAAKDFLHDILSVMQDAALVILFRDDDLAFGVIGVQDARQ
ncbi:MAG TPA: hypothetical protein VGE56_00795 [Rhodocyclaceae bacterium]